MKLNFRFPSGLVAGLLIAVSATAMSARARAADEAAPAKPAAAEAPAAPVAVAPTPTPAPAPAADEVETGEPPARIHVNQEVAIGGHAEVPVNQVADGVVVIRGDAVVDGEVSGDVVVVLGHLKLNGKVRGDVVVVMGDAEINGEVKGDLVMVFTKGHLGPRANIRGHTAAIGVAPLVDAGARMHGRPEIVDLGPIAGYVDLARGYLFQGVFLLRPFPPGLRWVWMVAAAFLAFHLLLALVFGSAIRGCIQTVRERPARSFLVGLLTCILVGPVSVLLSFTVVAVPLIWLAYLLLCVFGRVSVYGAAGAGLLRTRGDAVNPFVSVLLGSVLFYTSYMVPVLGFAVYWLVLPWGVGAALIRLGESLRGERRATSNGPGPGTGFGIGNPAMAAAGAIATGHPGPATHASVEASAPPPVSPGIPPVASGVPPTGPAVPPGLAIGPSPIELAAMPRAGFWPRAGALLIDLIVIGFLNAMSFETVKAFWLLLGLYHFVMWNWKGTTLGGSILSLRLIRLDGRALDWQTCAYRLLGGVVSMLPLGLGFFWVAWDDESQSWHDRIAGTTIVRADRRAALI